MAKINSKSMKKCFISLITFYLLLNIASVQAQEMRSYWLNGVVGLNSNLILNQNAYGNPEMKYASTFAPSLGMGFNYFFSGKLGFNTSVFMTKMGQNYTGEQAGGQAKRQVNLTYVEVPFLLMSKIPYSKYPTWISYGPDVMLLLKAKQGYNRVGGSPLQNPEGMAEGNITKRFKRGDVALNVSLNQLYSLNYFNNLMLLFSINSAVGLTDINKLKTPNLHDIYGKSSNFYIGIKLGLMFKLASGNSKW